MRNLIKLQILAVILVLSFFAFGAKPPPHENPYTAPLVFDGVSIFHKYSEALDYVLQRNPDLVESLESQASQANIPAELKEEVSTFLFSGKVLARLLPVIEEKLNTTRTLLSQFRLKEASESKGEASKILIEAYSELKEIEKAALDTARHWQADTAPPESRLRLAYEEVMEKLLRLRNLLDLWREMLYSLGKQIETVSTLQPTTLTLEIEPLKAFVGEEVSFWGRLSSEEGPLPGRKINLLFNKAPLMEIETDNDGCYFGKLSLPYEYKPQASLQAIYYPRGEDIGLYLGSSSPLITIEVLFYQTTLVPEVEEPAYPGRALPIKGRLEYGEAPIPESRLLQLYWDGRLVMEEEIGKEFSLELPISENEGLGKHRLEFYVLPQKRYAPIRVAREVEVTKATPVIFLKVPRVLFLPFGAEVEGKAHSPLGPLENAKVKVSLDKWRTETNTGKEGNFSAHLGTGMSLTLAGFEPIKVLVIPSEPWHQTSYLTAQLLIINPLNISGLALALVALGFLARPRLRPRKAFPPTPALSELPATPAEKPLAAAPSKKAEGSHASLLLSIYRIVLGLVQRALGTLLLPSQTLREFAQKCAPKLGPLGKFLWELTYLVEKVIYSQHPPQEEDLTRAQELGKKLEEGLK